MLRQDANITMGDNMKRRISICLVVAAAIFFSTAAIAKDDPAEFQYAATKDLVRFVNAAAALVANKGAGAFADLSKPGSKWFNGNSYIFAFDKNMVRTIYPPDEKMVGEKTIRKTDFGGKPIFKWMSALAKRPNNSSMWLHYQWLKPGQTTPSWKSSYLIKVTDRSGTIHILGSGIYDPKMEKKFIQDLVGEAVALIHKDGQQALKTLSDKKGKFFFHDTYLFGIYDDGVEFLNPAEPKLVGKNRLEHKDAKGKPYVKEMIDISKKSSSGWISYYKEKPGETEPSLKTSYFRKVIIGGKPGLIGAGYYK
jgi:signal transduction histidine kinase